MVGYKRLQDHPLLFWGEGVVVKGIRCTKDKDVCLSRRSVQFDVRTKLTRVKQATKGPGEIGYCPGEPLEGESTTQKSLSKREICKHFPSALRRRNESPKHLSESKNVSEVATSYVNSK